MRGQINTVVPFRVRHSFSVAKREDLANEDRCACYESTERLIFALSDGASVSFDPGSWADILTRRFIKDYDVSPDWLKAAAEEYAANYDRNAMEWMYQAAFDRGSFATLLGIIFSQDGTTARAFAAGDSLLAVVDGHALVRTIPYRNAEEFDSAPWLLSTSPFENSRLDQKTLADAWHELDISAYRAPVILLLTDALGRWLLEDPSLERVSALLRLTDAQAFTSFVERERNEGRLRRDDTTLVVIGRRDDVSPDH
jgi:hypothetical protein